MGRSVQEAGSACHNACCRWFDTSRRNSTRYNAIRFDGNASFQFPLNTDGIRADVDGNIWASAGWIGDVVDGSCDAVLHQLADLFRMCAFGGQIN